MPTYELSLIIDFGQVGWHNSKEPFRVKLDASSLGELIDHTALGHRIYEFLLIDRPGDIWDYVHVTPEVVPADVARRIKNAKEAMEALMFAEDAWPDGRIPFRDFDRLFHWAWDDTEPPDEAWRSHRENPVMANFAKQGLAAVCQASAGLGLHDALITDEIARARSGTHPYSLLSREVAIEESREFPPTPPRFPAGMYEKLRELLKDESTKSVSYYGGSDYHLLRQLCIEQRRRMALNGEAPERVLAINAVTDQCVNINAWAVWLRFYMEGLGYGDVLILENFSGDALKKHIETDVSWQPRVGVLIPGKESIEIAGYTRHSGDDWTFFAGIPGAPRRYNWTHALLD